MLRAQLTPATASGPVLVDDLLELVRHQVQGLVPGGLAELAVLLDQGRGQAFRGVDEVVAEAALHAEAPLVGRGALHAGHLDDLAVLDVQPQLAAHARSRGRWCGSSSSPRRGPDPRPSAPPGPPSGRTATHSAAKDAVRTTIGIVGPGDDFIVGPPVADADGPVHLPFVAGPDAAATHDALGKIPADQVLAVFDLTGVAPAERRNWGWPPGSGRPGPAARRRRWPRTPGSCGCRRPAAVRGPCGGRRPPGAIRS